MFALLAGQTPDDESGEREENQPLMFWRQLPPESIGYLGRWYQRLARGGTENWCCRDMRFLLMHLNVGGSPTDVTVTAREPPQQGEDHMCCQALQLGQSDQTVASVWAGLKQLNFGSAGRGGG